MTVLTKMCTRCGDEKSLDFYYRNKSAKDGRGVYCKPCWQAYMKERKIAEPETYRRSTKTMNLRKKYGMSLEDFENMRREQGWACAICDMVVESESQLCVDHDHETGAVRSLLCFSCNGKLGAIEDAEWRIRAEAYLILHEGNA